MSDENQEVQSTGTELGNGASEAQEPQETPQKEVLSPEKEVETQEEVAAYQPNYKFKVSKEEKEFDEFIRGSIKDKETEEKTRKLYTDAYGMEAVKPELDSLRKNYPELETNYNQLNTAVNEVLDLGQKDLGMFFERLKIPEERVAQWMLERIRKMELPPEQKAMYDQFEQTKRQNLEYQKQFDNLNQQSQMQAVQARTFELESTLQRPDVSSFASAFDAARKTPGAFRKEIQECGLYEWKVNGKDISASEATQAVMSRYQGMINPVAPGTIPGNAVETPLPVIPRLQGKSVSSVGKQVRSIQNLREKYKEIAG